MDDAVPIVLVGVGKSQADDTWCKGKSHLWYMMKGTCQMCTGQDEDKHTGKTCGQTIPQLWDGRVYGFPDKYYLLSPSDG